MTIEWFSVESAPSRGPSPDESAVVHGLRRARAAECNRADQAELRAADLEAQLRRVRRQLLAARGGPLGTVVVVLAAVIVGWWIAGQAGVR